MDKYRVVDYFDVWRNSEEGYEVNNLAEVGYIEVKDYTNYNEIIGELKDMEYLVSEASIDMFEVWNDYEMIEFSTNQGKPLFRLELVREG